MKTGTFTMRKGKANPLGFAEENMNVKDRFFNYISVHTTSDEDSGLHPSAEREFDLARILEKELKDLGLEQVTLSDTCYVYGFLPATKGMEDKKTIAFVSHMDTAPDYNGKDVHPQTIENYDGKDVVLQGTGAVLSVKDFPHLPSLKGRTLITTDGTSLLGCDDKAGVAEIVTAVETLIQENIPHGPLWICFTPDEEIGEGSLNFDMDICKADFAYTVDGSCENEVAYENFNAASAEFEIHGKNVHPGEAKDIMVNASRIGCEIAMRLPLLTETPATTEGREGFYHLTDMEGNVEKATLSYILRDHDKKILEGRFETLRGLEKEFNQIYGEGTVLLTITHTYDNMISVIKDHMEIVDLAKEAISAQGLTPISEAIRGGTDGANLSFKGLPCPNLGTGGYGFHGPFEHCTVEGMETMVKIITYIMSHAM